MVAGGGRWGQAIPLHVSLSLGLTSGVNQDLQQAWLMHACADCVLGPDWAKYLKDGPGSAKGLELHGTVGMQNDRAGQLTIVSQGHSTLGPANISSEL